MTYTLEDYLVSLHPGSWFTWTDSSNKVYANLILAPVMNNEAGQEIANPHSKPSESDCTAGVAALQSDWDAKDYARDRVTEYPSTGDQLDMLWHAIDTGDWTAAKVKLTSFYTELKAVKDKYPKE